jgi:cytochrome o ubiquinol oxidase subunit IV
MSNEHVGDSGANEDPVSHLEIEDDGTTNPQTYLTGLALAIILTLASFGAALTHVVWGPGLPVLLAVLAVAQMGVHLVFFMHVNATEEGENTVLALGFGIFIVLLVVFGSIIIMNNLSSYMPSMDELMKMQR